MSPEYIIRKYLLLKQSVSDLCMHQLIDMYRITDRFVIAHLISWEQAYIKKKLEERNKAC